MSIFGKYKKKRKLTHNPDKSKPELVANVKEEVERPLPEGLQVTSLTYSLLRNTGNYENERIELTAKVHEGEDATRVAMDLKVKAVDTLEVISRIRSSANKTRKTELFNEYDDEGYF